MANWKKIALSHYKGEWWYGHLRKALTQLIEVHPFFRKEEDPIGFDIESDITTLLKDWDGEDSFYLGSICATYRGINRLRIPTALWTDYLPLNDYYLPLIRQFDQVFCTQKDSKHLLEQAGCSRVHWLPFGFDETLKNDHTLEKIYEVAFVGNLDLPATTEERRRVLPEIEKNYRMNDYRTSCFGDGMMHTYNQSKMVVNIPALGGFNMRTFEAMASGALLLTKNVGNGQADLFQDGTHFVSYTDTADLLEKIDYYLKHEAERLAISENGMREVLSNHTYRHRAFEMLKVMAANLATKGRDASPSGEWAALAFAYRHEKRLTNLIKLCCTDGMPLGTRISISKKVVTCLASLCRNALK